MRDFEIKLINFSKAYLTYTLSLHMHIFFEIILFCEYAILSQCECVPEEGTLGRLRHFMKIAKIFERLKNNNHRII